MSKVQDDHLLEVAKSLAHEASEAIHSYLGKPIEKKIKADSSPVTAADFAADKIIREGLRAAFSDHGILTEETGYLPESNQDFTWVVDPLDGTKAFAKNIPGFCVMIGLLKGGKPHLGVLVDPMEGHEYWAIRGKGAFHRLGSQTTQVKVSSRNQFSEMPLIISTGFPNPKLEAAKKSLGCPVLPPINSVGIKVGLMVRQLGDIYLNHHGVHYWDTCAPQIILEEAGGVMTTIHGDPLEYDLKKKHAHPAPTLATNGSRHSDLIKLIQQFMD